MNSNFLSSFNQMITYLSNRLYILEYKKRSDDTVKIREQKFQQNRLI